MCNNSCSVDTYSGSSFDSGSLQRVLPSHRWSPPIPTDQTHFFHLHTKKKSYHHGYMKTNRFSAWSMSLKCYNSFVILAYPDFKRQRSSNIHSLRLAPQSEGSSTSHSETRWPITTPSGISNAIKTWKKCPASVFCSLAGCCTVTTVLRFSVHWLVVVPLMLQEHSGRIYELLSALLKWQRFWESLTQLKGSHIIFIAQKGINLYT